MLLIVALATTTFIRLRLLDFPLERDEGEYAYAGQLILQGVPPYQECYNMKWPGTYLAYAVIMGLFGETPAGIHLGVLFVSLASAWLVFLIGRRIGGLRMGAAAATMEALLAVSPSTYGFAGHATHFVVLPALGGLLILMAPWSALRWGRCLAAGVLFGVATIMKQPGAVFGLFAAAWLAWRGIVEEDLSLRRGREIWTRLGFLAAGGILAILTMIAWLGIAGVYGKFWHWTVEYAHAYIGVVTFNTATICFTEAVERLWAGGGGLWLLAGAGGILLWRDPALRRWRFFLLGFAFFTFIGVCPGYYFRGHYFLLLLPAASLLCGAAWQNWPSLEDRSGLAQMAEAGFPILLILAADQSLWAYREVYFKLSPAQACRSVYEGNPFTVAQEIARRMDANCPPGARIAVLGSEPEICFYSHRRSATGYIYTYPLMEAQPFAAEMQREMAAEIERAAPEYLVFVSISASWMKLQNSDPGIFNWMDQYTERYMTLDGMVELLPGMAVESRWGLNGQHFMPRSNCSLWIFRKKPTHNVIIPMVNQPG